MLFNVILAVNFLFAPPVTPIEEIEHLESTTEQTTRIYLIRHGESTLNVADENGMHYVSGTSLTIPLTENGEKQASLVGQKLVGKLAKDETYILLSSTAHRAQQTADLIFNQINQHYDIQRNGSYDHLYEMSQGTWEGQPRDEKYDLAVYDWKIIPAKEKYMTPWTDSAECYSDVVERFLPALQNVVDDYPNKTILLTTHAAAMTALTIHLNDGVKELSEEPETLLPSLGIKNCDILLLEVENGQPLDQAKVIMHIKSGV